MPTYALLGATGATGLAIVRSLLSHPPDDLRLNLFMRSKSKLIDNLPDLENTTAFKVAFFEGTPGDNEVTRECLKDVDVVMGCIGSNLSTRGISVIFDTATSITKALEIHRKAQGAAYKPPTIIQLRSASLNPIFKAALPWPAKEVAPFCFKYVYDDLDRACKLFEARSPDLLKHIYVDPPSIHDADGTTPTGYELILEGKQEPAISYADLGAAFCEVAKRREEFAGRDVGVTATGAVNLTRGTLVGYMATGLKGRIWGLFV